MTKHSGFIEIELPIRLGIHLAEKDFPTFRNEPEVEAIAAESFMLLAQGVTIPDRALILDTFLSWFKNAYRERRDAIFSEFGPVVAEEARFNVDAAP
jgi:hypothetical protein